MIYEKHVAIAQLALGNGYPEVNKWIDDCFPILGGFRHWAKRHHLQALEEKYGKNTPEYLAGCLHIVLDWMSHWNRVYLPKNKEEVERLIEKMFGR